MRPANIQDKHGNKSNPTEGKIFARKDNIWTKSIWVYYRLISQISHQDFFRISFNILSSFMVSITVSLTHRLND